MIWSVAVVKGNEERDIHTLYDIGWNHCLCDVFQWPAYSNVNSYMFRLTIQ